MLIDIDTAMRSLNDLMSGIADIDISRYSSKKTYFGLFDTSINISILGFDSLLDTRRGPKIYPQINEAEQPVDVFEDDERITIIAHFPRVKKEDISFSVKEGAIDLEVRRNGHVHQKKIPCNVKPDEVSVTSTTYNNSVLEIVFKKGT